MLLQPRMIGRALECVVERYLDSKLLRRANEGREIVEGAERRLDRHVSATLVADCPRAADVGRLGRRRVVFAFAKGLADWMDRGQIHDIEAELGNARESFRCIGECAVSEWKVLP